MANVQLPSINQGEQDTNKMVKQLLNAYIMLTEELTFMLNNLDTRNINELNAEVIIAGSITADKITVDKLSALSANLGKITAGEVYGAYIATREAGYPKVELSNTSDMIGAFRAVDNFIKIYTLISDLSPIINFGVSGKNTYLFHDVSNNKASFTSNDVGINISSPTFIELYANMVKVQAWSTFINNTNGRSLQQEIDTLNLSINSRATKNASTGSGGSANGGIPIGTVLRTADGGTVTWNGIPSHSHTQS